MKTTYYYCNHTGMYCGKGKRKRRLKTQGSCKIGGHCTSTLKLTEIVVHDKSEFELEVCKTHYAHQKQLGHLRLSNTEKMLIGFISKFPNCMENE